MVPVSDLITGLENWIDGCFSSNPRFFMVIGARPHDQNPSDMIVAAFDSQGSPLALAGALKCPGLYYKESKIQQVSDTDLFIFSSLRDVVVL